MDSNSPDQTPTPQEQTVEPTSTPDPFSGTGPWEIDLGDGFSGSITGFHDPVLIILPDYPGDSTIWSSLIQKASENGLDTLTLIPDNQDTFPEGEALIAALFRGIELLNNREVTSYFMLGAGDIAITAILGAPDMDGLAGLILLSPSWTNGIDTLTPDDVEALDIPSLWLASRQDMLQDSEEMIENAVSPLAELWIYEGSGLRGAYILDGLDKDDAIRRILAFIEKN